MFNKILISQTTGSNLQFRPESSMGFTTGNNHIIVSFSSYTPMNTHINLGFTEQEAPTLETYPEFNTSYTAPVSNPVAAEPYTVNPAIEAAVAEVVIDYLKSFNIGCEFEIVPFNQPE